MGFAVHSVKQERPIRVAIGPEMPDWGSWDWVGGNLLSELGKCFQVQSFSWGSLPECDVLIVVKHSLPSDAVQCLSPATRIVYCPIDYYGSSTEIDRDSVWLRRCQRILVHSQNLLKYFCGYAATAYLDHSVKFISERPVEYRTSGPLLWVGVHTNLQPVVEWSNTYGLPGDLLVLTNAHTNAGLFSPADCGFSKSLSVQIEAWSPARHRQALEQVRAAIDIKGSDFRSRHKPPVKALDFLASGVPLAMNPETSSVQHLAGMGFEIADPRNPERWFSREYWEETRQFGLAIRELLCPRRIGLRMARVIHEVLMAV